MLRGILPVVKTRRIASVRGKIDFAVITIRDDELTAIRKRFSPSIPVLDGRQHYDIHKLQKLDGSFVTVAIARAMEQGHSAALLAARYAIEDLDVGEHDIAEREFAVRARN